MQRSLCFFVASLLIGVLQLVCARSLDDALLQEYDYIVVGGGASGLTVANRLTENPDINVLLLEAGQADPETQPFLVPVFIGAELVSDYNWGLTTVPQTYLDGATRWFPQGRALGGGTILNALLWNRGGQKDYNDWVALGNPGWGWADMLPYFIKSERFSPVTSSEVAADYGIGFDSAVHGYQGPVSVSFPKFFYNASHQFFAALEYLGVPIVEDPNEGSQAGAYFLPQDITSDNQTRSDARRSYYNPYAGRPNFWVSTGQHVTRLIFDQTSCGPGASTKRRSGLPLDKEFGRYHPNEKRNSSQRVVGVEFAADASVPPTTIYATREVILAAGALHTPQLLELSGVGSSRILQQYNITPIIDLPGVGNNLQDHWLVGTYAYFYNNSYVYPNELQSNATYNQLAMEEYYRDRTGPWTSGPADGVAFPSLPQLSDQTARIVAAAQDQRAEEYLADGLDPTVIQGYGLMKQLMTDALSDPQRAAIEMLNNNQGGVQLANMRGLSRGTVHIQSPDPFQQPAIDPRYGSNPVDMDVLVEAARFLNAIMASPPIRDVFHPWQMAPPANASAATLMDYISRNSGTEFHPSGTCAMMPRHLGGVVDANLLVYGTQNLRIVDASMQPLVPAAHLQAVVYGVAEKAADIIKQANTQHLQPGDNMCSFSFNATVSSSTASPLFTAQANSSSPKHVTLPRTNFTVPLPRFKSGSKLAGPKVSASSLHANKSVRITPMPTVTVTETSTPIVIVTETSTATVWITPPSGRPNHPLALPVLVADVPPYAGTYPDTHPFDHPWDESAWAQPWSYLVADPPNASEHAPHHQNIAVQPSAVAPWARPWFKPFPAPAELILSTIAIESTPIPLMQQTTTTAAATETGMASANTPPLPGQYPGTFEGGPASDTNMH